MICSERFKLQWQFVVFCSLAEIKSEASRNYLGILWWIVEPLAYLGAFYFIFAVGFRAGGPDFLVFLLTGLVPWKWFATTISTASRSIEGSAGLIRQVDVRKWTLVLSVVLANFWKFLMILSLLLIFLTFYGYPPTLRWIALIPIAALQMILMAGLSICVATAMPFVPDLRLIIENGLFIAFVSAGVFFDVAQWPDHVRVVLDFHPMVWFLDSYRSVLLNQQPVDWPRLLMWGGVGSVLVVTGLAVLRHFDRVIPRVL